jgi:SHS family sialic acid transporter-like MFS transporter
MSEAGSPLGSQVRWLPVIGGFAAWFCAGVQMALMPVASRTASSALMGTAFDERVAGQWFAWYTVAFLLGGAAGGWLFGSLGDRIGRARAMALSVLTYSLVSALGGWVETQPQLLVVRLIASLGIGGVWPNCMSLAAESWPNTSRPFLAGLLGSSANLGVAMMGAIGHVYPVTAETWRNVMWWSATPAIVGLFILWCVPESARWRQSRGKSATATSSASVPQAQVNVFRPPLLGRTLLGIALGTVPLLGAWGAGKWLLPWADSYSGELGDHIKGTAQFLWGIGAAIGAFLGGHLAAALGRRASYFLISVMSLVVNFSIFCFLTPASASFLPAVFVLGFVSTLFFGWLPLYLPELFPTRARATGSGVSYNFGRIFSAPGVLGAGALMSAFGDYARVGMTVSVVYAIGMIIIWWAPNTGDKLSEE